MMTSKHYRKAAAWFAAWLGILLTAGLVWAASIKVAWDPGRVKPGGVVLISVQSPVSLLAAEATAGGETFPLLSRGQGSYAVLMGIDPDVREASVPVDLALFPLRGGPPFRIRADLTVKKTTASARPVQKLSLPTGMVDLTQKRVSQVRRDNRNLGDALAERSRERFWKEGFILPVKGRITTRFGTGRVLNGKPRAAHSGVDIAADRGVPVRAANGGVVQLADGFYLSGNTVVLDHGWGVSTIYGHLEEIKVQEGTVVERGQAIGTVGSTGRATGPHLHFGAFIRGAKIDPLQLIEVTRDL